MTVPGLWRAVLAAVIAVPLLALPACSASRPILKVGLAAPFTGWDESLGYSVLHAVRLALRESYQRGGAGGYMLELVALDDRNDPVEAAQQARELAIDPDVLAAITGWDDEVALAAAPEYQRLGLPVIVAAVAAPGSAGAGSPILFRMAPGDDAVARAAVTFLTRNLQARRVALVQDAAEAGLARAIQSAATQAGITVVPVGEVHRWQLDFGRLAADLASRHVDAVFFAGRVSEAGPLLAACRAAGLRAPFVAVPAADDPRLGQLAGDAVQNVFTLGLGQVAPGSPFVAAYSAAAGYPPSWRAGLAYDAAELLVAAVERAARDGRPTRASVRAALAQTKGYAGVSGRVSFGSDGANTDAAVAVYALTGRNYPGAVVP